MPFSTSRVFLDTEVFIRAHFDYESPAFEALLKHIKHGRVELFLTEVTLREIHTHLKDAIVETLDRFEIARRRSGLIRHSHSAIPLITEVDAAAITKEELAGFDAFLEKCNATILPVKDAYLKSVLNDYFGRKPPFGLAKEKAQFPDALAIAALTDYAKADQTICVVTGDKAFKEGCNPLHHLVTYETLPAFLDAVASEDQRADFLHEALPTLDETIIPMIEEQFLGLSFDLHREWGEIHRVEVLDVALGEREIDILDLDKASALVMEYAAIRFKAYGEVLHDAPDSFAAEDFRITKKVNREVIVYLSTDYKSRASLKVESVSLADTGEVSIRLDEW
jgi:predicted nucleic acid-binding protein